MKTQKFENFKSKIEQIEELEEEQLYNSLYNSQMQSDRQYVIKDSTNKLFQSKNIETVEQSLELIKSQKTENKEFICKTPQIEIQKCNQQHSKSNHQKENKHKNKSKIKNFMGKKQATTQTHTQSKKKKKVLASKDQSQDKSKYQSRSFKKKKLKKGNNKGLQLFELQIKKKLNMKKKKPHKKKMMMDIQSSENRIFGSVKNNNRQNFSQQMQNTRLSNFQNDGYTNKMKIIVDKENSGKKKIHSISPVKTDQKRMKIVHLFNQQLQF